MAHPAIDKLIIFENDFWRVIGVGAINGPHQFVHLAHTTRGRFTKNGFHPIQKGVWVSISALDTGTVDDGHRLNAC